MAIRALIEGTPYSVKVQPFNPSAPVYWEAGSIGMLDANGNAVVSDGTAAFGVIAERRGNTVGISTQTLLASAPGQYGDESLFNQPGYGNDLFGAGNVIPFNAIPLTTIRNDQTAANPNLGSRYLAVYIRGGVYETDQYDSTQTYVPGQTLYVDTVAGRLTNVVKTVAVGEVVNAVDGNGQLTFKLTLV